MTSDHHGDDDALVNELRHRFRNALQVMNSLVGLHARGIKDPHAVRAFADLRSRISIMARIFADLDDEPGDTIDLGVFLPRVAHLVANQHDLDGACTLRSDIAPVKMLKTRAGTLAQILAELLMTPFRQRSDRGAQTQIDVTLSHGGEGLILSTTGAAQLPNGPHESAADQLTLTIVNSLAMTLNAVFEPTASADGSCRLIIEMPVDRQH